MGIRGIDIYIYIHTTIPHVYRWLNQLSYKKGHHISLLWLVESWFLKVKPINPANSTIFAGEIPISLNWILFFVGSTLKNPPFFIKNPPFLAAWIPTFGPFPPSVRCRAWLTWPPCCSTSSPPPRRPAKSLALRRTPSGASRRCWRRSRHVALLKWMERIVIWLMV